MIVRLALLASLVAACKSEPRTTTTVIGSGGGMIAPRDADTSVIPTSTTHLVTIVVDDWEATAATMRLFVREGDRWVPQGEPWPAVVGRTGSAWGMGLHGNGAPPGRDGPRKREGDGKSPAGVFAIRKGYGYATAPPAGTALPYSPVTPTWRCVDDPTSSHYNEILDEASTTKDWSSAEDMRRDDDLYRWVVELAHNPQRTPADGSCIFLHVWGGPTSSTAGCTAMAEDELTALMAALPADGAVAVLLPKSDYAALAGTWLLPSP